MTSPSAKIPRNPILKYSPIIKSTLALNADYSGKGGTEKVEERKKR